jgi:hypothetical protein
MDRSTINVFVSGGTGSFGKKFAEIMLRDYHPRKLVIFIVVHAAAALGPWAPPHVAEFAGAD